MKKHSIIRKIIASICLAAVFVSTSGCATLFGPKKQNVYASSTPSGADVYVNGIRMGTTPYTLNLKPNQEYMVEFKKAGYKTIGRSINSKVGAGWVILDVLGGLIPVVIDAATGSWKKLDQDAVDAQLEKEN
ncbi:MAG: PEGA domain-containing protein [Leadbetterella sp.]|nr:PEGA domain-containing protein [Leadbetterella sp.]